METRERTKNDKLILNFIANGQIKKGNGSGSIVKCPDQIHRRKRLQRAERQWSNKLKHISNYLQPAFGESMILETNQNKLQPQPKQLRQTNMTYLLSTARISHPNKSYKHHAPCKREQNNQKNHKRPEHMNAADQHRGQVVVELYEQGYGRDAASIARSAINYGTLFTRQHSQ